MHRTFHDMKFLFHSYLDFFSLNKKFQRLKVNDFSTTNVKEDDFIELLKCNSVIYGTLLE